MSTPLEYYQSLPPVTKTYGVICFMTTAAYQLQLYNLYNIALVYSRAQKISGVEANHKFLLHWAVFFDICISFIDDLFSARYGVSLEKVPFEKRTADYLWMFLFGAFSLLVMTAIPYFYAPFLGPSIVFMILYVWSREFPNERINIHGLVTLKGFYLPWYYLAVDLILGNPLMPNFLGMAAGHLFYFLTVLHPLASGKNYLKTPLWVHKLTAFWGEGFQINAPVQRNPQAGVAFQGRSRRLNGSTRTSTSEQRQTSTSAQDQTMAQPNPATGEAFRGRGHRLGAR